MYASCSYWPAGGALVHFRAPAREREALREERDAERERLAGSAERGGTGRARGAGEDEPGRRGGVE